MFNENGYDDLHEAIRDECAEEFPEYELQIMTHDAVGSNSQPVVEVGVIASNGDSTLVSAERVDKYYVDHYDPDTTEQLVDHVIDDILQEMEEQEDLKDSTDSVIRIND